MRRISVTPRVNWKQKVHEQGLAWAEALEERCRTPIRYWDESAFYEITAAEQDQLESATNELHQMCIAAAGRVIEQKRYAEFAIPDSAVGLIEKTWQEEPPSLYGRFDLALAPDGRFKMLEYNADTPTALLEAAVCQWAWFEDTKLGSDQFNSIHDRLIDTWKYFVDWIPGGQVSFTSIDSIEDGFTLAYLQETASRAGYRTESFPIKEMGWDGREFVSGNSIDPLHVCFKLYPWEWMIHEEFGKHLAQSKVVWIEPAWKMLLSNKAILPVLWEMYPGHPNLLEATLTKPADEAGWVRKPILGREGNNICIAGKCETGGEYGEEGFIYQRDAATASFDGNYPVVGSWIVGQQSSGIGIRESRTPITDNLSRFIPHVMA